MSDNLNSIAQMRACGAAFDRIGMSLSNIAARYGPRKVQAYLESCGLAPEISMIANITMRVVHTKEGRPTPGTREIGFRFSEPTGKSFWIEWNEYAGKTVRGPCQGQGRIYYNVNLDGTIVLDRKETTNFGNLTGLDWFDRFTPRIPEAFEEFVQLFEFWRVMDMQFDRTSA